MPVVLTRVLPHGLVNGIFFQLSGKARARRIDNRRENNGHWEHDWRTQAALLRRGPSSRVRQSSADERAHLLQACFS
eukprot:3428788-Pyramimonas_sp.AAC.1